MCKIKDFYTNIKTLKHCHADNVEVRSDDALRNS